MSAVPSTSKVCAVCKQDCSTKPRVKDPVGHYFCKPCHDKITAENAKPKPPAKTAPVIPAPAPDDNDFNWSQDDLASLQSVAASEAPSIISCPQCGTPVSAAAILCTDCGYNIQTGKKGKIKVTKAKERGGSNVGEQLWNANPLAWVLAALLGGGITTGIWIALSFQAGLMIPMLEWVVVLAISGSVLYVAKGYACWLSGVIASGATLGILVAMPYVTSKLAVARDADKANAAAKLIDIDDAKLFLAVTIAKAMRDEGMPMTGSAQIRRHPEEARAVDDLPKEVVAEFDTQWGAMSAQDKDTFLTNYKARMQTEVATKHTMLNESIDNQSASDAWLYLVIMFNLLPTALAYCLASGWYNPFV